MKKLTILILLAICTVSCVQDVKVEKSTLEEKQCYGSIKQITNTMFITTKGKERVSGFIIEDYNEDGMITLLTRTKKDGTINGVTTYEYDNMNRLISSMDYLGEYEALWEEETYHYTNNKRTYKQVIHTRDGDNINTQVDEYDQSGKIIKTVTNEKYYFEEDGQYQEIIFGYDEDDNNNSKVVKDKEKVLTQTTYEYDDKGNVIKSESKNSNNNIIITTTHEYDENNDLIYRRSEGGSEEYNYSTSNLRYGEEGLLVELISRSEGEITNQLNLEYIFDAYGNWTEKIEKTENQKKSITIKRETRVITYYE